MSDARTVIETVCEVWFDEFNRAKGGPMRPLPPMILAALAEAGLVIVPATLLHKIPNEPPMSGKPQITLEGSE